LALAQQCSCLGADALNQQFRLTLLQLPEWTGSGRTLCTFDGQTNQLWALFQLTLLRARRRTVLVDGFVSYPSDRSSG
jgi:hypothetical protein